MFPVIYAIPIFDVFGYLAHDWLWWQVLRQRHPGSLLFTYSFNRFTPSFSYVGQGIIMGFPTTASMNLGMLCGWAFLAPLSKLSGWAPGPVGSTVNGARGEYTVNDSSAANSYLSTSNRVDPLASIGDHDCRKYSLAIPSSSLRFLSTPKNFNLINSGTRSFARTSRNQGGRSRYLPCYWWCHSQLYLLRDTCFDCVWRRWDQVVGNGFGLRTRVDLQYPWVRCSYSIIRINLVTDFIVCRVRALGETDLNPFVFSRGFSTTQ